MRLNNPNSYIDWLKTTPSFRKGELNDLPDYCIVIHDSLIVEHLTTLGYSLRNYRVFKIGATDPIEFLLVRDSNSDFEFILMSGLPGAGGISTQVSELSSLGCKYFVHIGTCGLFNHYLNDTEIIISKGSLKDQGAILLSDDTSKISYPNESFLKNIESYFKRENILFQEGLGVTIPIFYHQPVSFIRTFLEDSIYHFIEMEQAPFFETCILNKVQGISIVVGSDRYTIENGEISHHYIELDQNKVKNKILEVCINYFKSLSE